MQYSQLEISYREDIYSLPDFSRTFWTEAYKVRSLTFHPVWNQMAGPWLNTMRAGETALDMAPNQ
jgi:hypothetical protein